MPTKTYSLEQSALFHVHSEHSVLHACDQQFCGLLGREAHALQLREVGVAAPRQLLLPTSSRSTYAKCHIDMPLLDE
jgi:hypothetical protein